MHQRSAAFPQLARAIGTLLAFVTPGLCDGEPGALGLPELERRFNSTEGSSVKQRRPWNRPFSLFDLGLRGSPGNRAPAPGETELARGRYHYVHQTGSLAHPLARFARMLRESAELRSVDLYTDRASAYLTAAERAVAIHDDEWRESAGGEGWYVARVGAPVWYQGLDHGFNKMAMLGAALVELARATDRDDCRRKARMLATTLKHDMVHVRDADAYKWPFYWSGGPTHSLSPQWEDISHAGATVLFAFTAHQSSIVFTDRDINRLANTWTRVVAPPGGAGIAHRVSGEGMGSGDPAAVRRGWLLLGLYDPSVCRFAERWFVEHGSRDHSRHRLAWASVAWVLRQREH